MRLHKVLLILGISCNVLIAKAEEPVLKTRYAFPASQWESEALPLGNSHIGGMIFGGVQQDLIMINEKSLWSGGPGKNPKYNGGHIGTPEENHRALQSVRTRLQKKMTQFTSKHAAYQDRKGNVIAADYAPEDSSLQAEIHKLMGEKSDFGSYQQLSDIHIINHNQTEKNHSDYSRELNIDSAIAKVSYQQHGIYYQREYFISHPDQVLAVRLTCDSKGALSRTFFLSTPQDSARIHVNANTITLEGRPADHGSQGLKFAQQLMIIPTGGEIIATDSSIIVNRADEILLLSSAATNYQLSMDDAFDYFSDVDPAIVTRNILQNAVELGYDNLRTRHIQDYRSLYGRMSLTLNGASNAENKTTDQLLSGYKNGTNLPAEDRYLEQLYFQFGRYLLIASSRKGSLPANLQGIWAKGLTPPWDADYHTNINVQMNYWLAEPTNLPECHLPVIEYTQSLVPRGRKTAQHYYCRQDGEPVRGWVIHHENNIWGNTAPGNWYTAFYFPAAAAWMCQDIWDHYRFTQDKTFLAKYYPTLLDAALFWVDNLWSDERDGLLVTNPSYSPEHGPYSLGTSADQAIISELFDMTIAASDTLGLYSSELDEIRKAKNNLAGPQIGLAGQFMEWKDELKMDITGDNGHRHVNHLFWLHPGSQVIPGRSPEENRFAEAMRVTLNRRGDGGTGWSKAWKINFWARLHDGNHAHKLVHEILKESTLPNLFDTHPPFQIDGNFGATAGMTEMLVQSQSDYIEILPSLPEAWNNGQFKGIKARGNFTIDAEWKNGNITALKITSGAGNYCKIKYKGKNYAFPTMAGITYNLRKLIMQSSIEQ